jgi:hypothetical protein
MHAATKQPLSLPPRLLLTFRTERVRLPVSLPPSLFPPSLPAAALRQENRSPAALCLSLFTFSFPSSFFSPFSLFHIWLWLLHPACSLPGCLPTSCVLFLSFPFLFSALSQSSWVLWKVFYRSRSLVCDVPRSIGSSITARWG